MKLLHLIYHNIDRVLLSHESIGSDFEISRLVTFNFLTSQHKNYWQNIH